MHTATICTCIYERGYIAQAVQLYGAIEAQTERYISIGLAYTLIWLQSVLNKPTSRPAEVEVAECARVATWITVGAERGVQVGSGSGGETEEAAASAGSGLRSSGAKVESAGARSAGSRASTVAEAEGAGDAARARREQMEGGRGR